MSNIKQLTLEVTSGGCIIPTSHKLNRDGYFRKQIKNADGIVRPVMYHRYVWEQVNGSIPDGYEVDHTCRNRACCNVDHLQLLTISEHKVKTNKERYANRNKEAREYWVRTGVTGSELGRLFGVTESCGCRWIRDWKSK